MLATQNLGLSETVVVYLILCNTQMEQEFFLAPTVYKLNLNADLKNMSNAFLEGHNYQNLV